MAKYLVTGGAGFIGSNLVKALLERGDSAVVLDNFSGGRYEDRIFKGVEYIEGDICEDGDVKKAVQGVQGVFHFAAIPRMPYSVEHPFETNEANVTGTLKLLIAARDAGVKRFVYSSSSSVYGRQEALPFKEDMKPNPLSPYGLQKLMGEEYCRLFYELYNFETVSLRYFNVYGPMMKFNGPYSLVISKFFTQRLNNEPLTLTGKGQYFRDFTHVADVVNANLLAMDTKEVGHGEAFNIGCGQAQSVMDLAKMVGGEIVFIPERKGDPIKTEADISFAKKMLGWEPKISLKRRGGTIKEGMEDCLNEKNKF